MQLFYKRKGSKKQWILDYFETWQKWPICKGYSLWKMINLGGIFELKKNSKRQKRLSNPITVVLCKKTSPKNNEYWKNEAILKIHKNGQYAKPIAFAKWSLWVKFKIAKKVPKTTQSRLQLLYAKNGSKKRWIFDKWGHFENCQKWSICKGYSLWKLSLSVKN